MTDLIAEVVTALVAGATAALKDTAGDAVKSAYAGLKSRLAGQIATLPKFEKKPGEETFQKELAAELQKKALTTDPAVLEAVRDLMLAIESEPVERLADCHIDITRIRAAHHVIIAGIESSRGNIKIEDIEARSGDVRIRGVKSGELEKN